jgi:hypothetical protein
VSEQTERKRQEILAELSAEARKLDAPLNLVVAIEMVRLLRAVVATNLNTQGQQGPRGYGRATNDF